MESVSILLVEDNAFYARWIEMAFFEPGRVVHWDLVWVRTLSEALKRVQVSPVDAILLDLDLPDSRGLSTLISLATAVPNFPIIVLAECEDELLALDLMQQGAQDYLVKDQLDKNLLGRSIRYAIESKQAQEQIRFLNIELERVVAQTAQLTANNKELEAFSYSVSHNLCSPARRIERLCGTLLQDHINELTSGGLKYVEHIRACAVEIAQLVDDLLSLAHVTHVAIDSVPVNLSTLARDIAGALQEEQPERKVEFFIMPNLVANGDGKLLHTALTNILNNAWKFTSKKQQGRIEFGAIHKDGEQVFYVRDNGAGFDMTYAGKLFHPFQRLHSSDDFPGTGLGLVIVEYIISKHSGKIWVESVEEQGTTFYFTL